MEVVKCICTTLNSVVEPQYRIIKFWNKDQVMSCQIVKVKFLEIPLQDGLWAKVLLTNLPFLLVDSS